jgi:hypothetical protein
MGETVFRFGVNEITSVRARCKHEHCGFVLEMPLLQVNRLTSHKECPGCGRDWWVEVPSKEAFGRPVEPFTLFQDAAARMLGLPGVAIEFVVAKAVVQ